VHARRTAAVATIATNRFLSRGHLLLLLHADATHAAAAAAAAAVGPCTPERHMGGASPRAPTLAALPALRTAPSPLACVAEQQSVDGRNTPVFATIFQFETSFFLIFDVCCWQSNTQSSHTKSQWVESERVT